MSISLSLLAAELNEHVVEDTTNDEMDLLDVGEFYDQETSFENYMALSDEMEDILEKHDSFDGMTMEQVEDLMSPDLFTMLSFDDPLSLERIEVGGVSRVFNRLWNSFYTLVANMYDWIGDLFKNNKKMMHKYKQRLEDARARFKRESADWNNGIQVGSYVSLHNYYFNDKGWVKSPINQLKIETTVSKYILEEYPSKVEKLINDFTSMSKKLDVSSPSFITDVDVMARKLEHPAYLFDKKYLGGRPYMMNVGFFIIGKRSKSDNQLDKISVRRHVSTTKLLTQLTGTINFDMSKQVIPDVKMTAKDLEVFIDHGFVLIAEVEKYYNSAKSPSVILGEMKSVIENIQNTGKDAPKSSQAVAKKLVKYAKNLMKCYYYPTIRRTKQTLEVTKAVGRLSQRIMSGAK